MNIDERLAALVDRHEALTETVKLLAERRAEAGERNARETAAFRRDLRRAFAMGVQEARNQRRRSAALDEKITQLAAAQLITEERLTACTARWTPLSTRCGAAAGTGARERAAGLVFRSFTQHN